MWIQDLTWEEIDKIELLEVSGIGALFGTLSYGLGEMLSLVWPTKTTGEIFQDLVNMLTACNVDEAIVSTYLNFVFIAFPQTSVESIITQEENSSYEE